MINVTKTRMQSLLFTSNLTFLFSSNWVNLYKGERVLKDAKSYSSVSVGVAVVGSEGPIVTMTLP